jgi:hypothetical protein
LRTIHAVNPPLAAEAVLAMRIVAVEMQAGHMVRPPFVRLIWKTNGGIGEPTNVIDYFAGFWRRRLGMPWWFGEAATLCTDRHHWH